MWLLLYNTQIIRITKAQWNKPLPTSYVIHCMSMRYYMLDLLHIMQQLDNKSPGRRNGSYMLDVSGLKTLPCAQKIHLMIK
jgi:hypothetical protein